MTDADDYFRQRAKHANIDLKARFASAFMPGVESASPGRVISHTPLETCEPPRSFLSYAAQAHRKLHP
jgi:hypothetical protein